MKKTVVKGRAYSERAVREKVKKAIELAQEPESTYWEDGLKYSEKEILKMIFK